MPEDCDGEVTSVYYDTLRTAGDFLIRIGATVAFASLVWLAWDPDSDYPGYLMAVAVVMLLVGYVTQ